MLKLIFTAFSAFLMFSSLLCKQQDTTKLTTEQKFIFQNCYTCHNPDSTITNRIAPSMNEIVTIYKKSSEDKKSLKLSMLDFLNHPNPENSKGKEWISKYGIMPKMSYNEDHLQSAISYLSEQEKNEEEWRKDYNFFLQNKDTSAPDKKDFLEIGRDVAMQSKAELGKNLMNAIKEKGSANAVEFCSSKAIPITEEMANKFKFKIKRVSDKPRNPMNQASDEEIKYIELFKTQIAKQEKLKPITKESASGNIGYYPIETNTMCLQCHGNPEKDIKEDVQKKITKLYPSDKAVGYGENQIRGMWVIEQ